jgi:hypothetical protein
MRLAVVSKRRRWPPGRCSSEEFVGGVRRRSLAEEELVGEKLIGKQNIEEELVGEKLPGEELIREDLTGEELVGEELPREELVGAPGRSSSRRQGGVQRGARRGTMEELMRERWVRYGGIKKREVGSA